jgi:hypothetical protein
VLLSTPSSSASKFEGQRLDQSRFTASKDDGLRRLFSPPPFTTPPYTRKRRASQLSPTPSEDENPSKRIAAVAPTPITPLTAASTNMDSEEEYMSGLSTEGDVGGMVSDDGSFGDGKGSLSLRKYASWA